MSRARWIDLVLHKVGITGVVFSFLSLHVVSSLARDCAGDDRNCCRLLGKVLDLGARESAIDSGHARQPGGEELIALAFYLHCLTSQDSNSVKITKYFLA